MSDKPETTVKRIGALDFGKGYVSIEASATVDDRQALDVVSDLIVWLRLMHAKYRPAAQIDGDWAE